MIRGRPQLFAAGDDRDPFPITTGAERSATLELSLKRNIPSCVPPSPSLAPDELPSDVTVYIVLNDFDQLGRAYVETDEAAADEQTASTLSTAASTPTQDECRAFNTPRGMVSCCHRGHCPRIA
jgi:hypothetical protein